MMVALRHVFHKLDSNNDGELTNNEQLAYFDKIDTNSNPKLNMMQNQYTRELISVGNKYTSTATKT